MNLRFLQTIVAIAEHQSFVAAGEALGLSHSAVSLHVKALEEELGASLVDRSRRPPVLTGRGLALVDHAKRIIVILDEIAGLAGEETLVGSLSVGVVPSALVNLLPPALAALRNSHPRLQIQVRSDLSADLAQSVRNGDCDVAVVSEPDRDIDGLQAHEICREPLFAIAPLSAGEQTVSDLLASHPFIWFSRKTWAGQKIEREILENNLKVRPVMEVDSLEAIASLVRNGIGVSVVPRRVCAPGFGDDLRRLAFGDPQLTRGLVMLERNGNPRRRLAEALLAQLRTLANEDTAVV